MLERIFYHAENIAMRAANAVLEEISADSDEGAREFRFNGAQDSDMKPPRAVGVVDEPVENGVGIGRIADDGVPVIASILRQPLPL
jgi:hypothetical protein